MKNFIITTITFLAFSITCNAQWTLTGSNLYPTTISNNVGIGTTSPNGKLDVNGAILVPGSTANTMVRPAISTSRITGEIAGYRGGNLLYDDGFLRLSAGGGTTAGVKTFIDLSGYSTVPDMQENIVFGTQGTERMRIMNTGMVGIGTSDTHGYQLAVNGNIHSKQVNVDLTNWPDYVFKKDYSLKPLSEVKTYIDQNQHLPEIPSAQQIAKDGLNLGEMNQLLMKKVEELTLYLIEENKQNKNQQNEINQLKQQLSTITKIINKK
ncbi:hypothetical protein [Mucilaginibacter sp. OK098]|uniref:hypothetical protein n=1 Tax=Mucilaginibacter sp. OK098 TaxID=1855297 RepID=UPI00092341E1|nr:hypothetical protein [Mucilaginibacter sp. OK098]SHN07626.1 hypothetical protein SAMN05216524_10550 [Mucilaginibacter sp. OK098]